MAIVRGTKGDDYIDGFDGDVINALAGGDFVELTGGWNIVRCGAGNDQVNGRWGDQRGEVWGGIGDDYLNWFGSGWAVGGKGNDEITAGDNCWLLGDEGPSITPKVVGDDILRTYGSTTGGVGVQTGGLGADWFRMEAHYDTLGGSSQVEVGDFTKGQDKLGLSLAAYAPDGLFLAHYGMADVFAILDSNGDGTLDGTDVNGPNLRAYVDEGDLVLAWREDTFRIDNVTSIDRSDWISG